MYKRLISVLVAIGIGTSTAAFADEGFDKYVESLKAEAKESGISADTITAAFDGITFTERAVKADKNQPEKKTHVGRVYSTCST